MRKSLLISTVSAIVLMSASHAFADTTADNWVDLKTAVENTGGTIFLGDNIKNVPNGGAITSYKPGTVIDGNSHTISASESTEDGNFRFISNSTAADIPLEIKNITFNGGHIISSSSSAQGGAIYNSGSNAKIGNIHGDFEGNYAKSTNSRAQGGAIYNWGAIGNITANFTNNHTESTNHHTQGGAIYNDGGTIGDIHGSFTNNHAESTNSLASGGAIGNETVAAKIGDIYGDFIGNCTKGKHASSGAIYNWGTIGNENGGIYGNFTNNHAESTNGIASGGAIGNEGKIEIIEGNFKDNHAESKAFWAYGGAIHSEGGFEGPIMYGGEIGDIKGNFENNYAKSHGTALGGAIYAHAITMGNIHGDFENNYVRGLDMGHASGGAIYDYYANIESIIGNFKNNYAEAFDGVAYGGAIYLEGGNVGYDVYSGMIGEIEGSFLNNHVQGNEDSKGGAIYSTSDITIVAKDGKTSEFKGNYVEAAGVQTPNAVYMEAGILNLKATTNGTIDFEDEIDGHEGYKIEINGTDQSRSVDQTGNVIFNNNIRNAAITLADSTVTLGNVSYLNNNNSLTINSGKFNVASLGVNDILTANSITVNGGVLNIAQAEVDLGASTQQMGQIDGSVLSVSGGTINVEKLLLSSDSEKEETSVLFIKDGTGIEVSHNDNSVQKAVAPVYKYDVSFNAETGEFVFIRAGAPDINDPEDPDTNVEPDVNWFNEGVFASDVFMMSSLDMQDDATKKVIRVTPKLDYTQGRVWAMPFYSDDTIEYKNFYDIDSRNYGLIAGVDTRVFGNSDLSHVYTLFGAYSEGKDKYEGIKVESKSWLLGLKASMFSDNGLYGDAIVDIASHDMDAKTLFGSDSHDTYGYGAALKGGYKHDIEKVNIDTSVMLSWQQIKGDDFTAKSGAKMKTDDYSRLSLMPQVKVGYDLNKVRPYALVRYNFVLDEEGSSVANDTTLPEIESKDYVEYGLGVETTTNSSHSGFAHVLRHDGGREGWSITAGYRYNF